MNKKLEKVKCFLLDMDGTVYLGNNLIEGAVDAVKRMNERCRAMFLTNNSSASRDDYAKKLTRMGFEVTRDDVFTSGNATVEYLNTFHKGKRIYLFGNESLNKEFVEGGIIPVEDNPDIAVVGFDISFDYPKLEKLCKFIADGVPYICTHPDDRCPTEYGFKPDVGSFIALIERSTGVSPQLVCGKPNKPIGDSIKRLLGLEADEIAMVGDRLSTDMQFAINNGFVSVFVLSGEGTMEALAQTGQKIDVILPSIATWDK